MSNTKSKKAQPYTSLLRGVDALLGEDVASILDDETAQVEVAAELIPLGSIALPESQPRKYFNPEKLEELTQSIRVHGILTPVLVRSHGSSKYELVAGERRYRAAKLAGLKQIPAVIRQIDDERALQIALVENLQREDLNPVEETEGILQLLAVRLGMFPAEVVSLLYRMQNEAKGKVTQNVLGNPEGKLIQDVFDGLGIIAWESFVSVRLPLLKLPSDVLENLRQGKLAYTKAQAIAKVKDDEQRQEILGSAIGESLSLSQIKERVKGIGDELSANEPSRAVPPPTLKTRVETVYRSIRKSKAWDNPQKAKQLEKILTSLEKLIADEP